MKGSNSEQTMHYLEFRSDPAPCLQVLGGSVLAEPGGGSAIHTVGGFKAMEHASCWSAVVPRMRSHLKHMAFFCLTALLLVIAGSAQQPSHPAGPATAASRRRIFVDGKPISPNQIIVKDGIS